MRKPLKGRSVLITRPKSASGPVAAALRRQGAAVIVTPLIKIENPKSFSRVDESLKRFERYHAVVFTSVNAVERFFVRSRFVLHRVPNPPSRVFSVGKKTADSVSVLTKGRWKSSTTPENAQNSAAIAKHLRVPRGHKVLMPRAERGLDTVPQALKRRGITVDVVSVYRSVPDEAGKKLFRKSLALGADIVVFASPSAARIGASDLKTCGAAAVAIGPTTAAALRAMQIDPVVAKDPSPASLAKAAVLAARSLP